MVLNILNILHDVIFNIDIFISRLWTSFLIFPHKFNDGMKFIKISSKCIECFLHMLPNYAEDTTPYAVGKEINDFIISLETCVFLFKFLKKAL